MQKGQPIKQDEYILLSSETYPLSTKASSGSIINTDSNYKSHIQYTIPDLIKYDDQVLYIQFSIPYAVFPVSFFNINEYNNTLVATVNSITTTYTIPAGGYSISTLITALQTALGVNWTITFNYNTLYLTFSNSIYEFSFLSTSTMDSVLGYSGTITSTSQTLTMPRIVNLFPTPVIHIRCPELATTNDQGIILTIPVSSSTNGQVVYQNNSGIKTILQSRDNINSITFRITDDDNNLLNFRGLSSFFSLEIETARKMSMNTNTTSFRDYIDILKLNPEIYPFYGMLVDETPLKVPRIGGLENKEVLN